QTDTAVGLLLTPQCKVTLGDVDEELTQELCERRKCHAAADAKPNQRTKQPRHRHMQLEVAIGCCEGGFDMRDFAFIKKCSSVAPWDTIPPFSWCVIFSHIMNDQI